jgi:hypothetical protein
LILQGNPFHRETPTPSASVVLSAAKQVVDQSVKWKVRDIVAAAV